MPSRSSTFSFELLTPAIAAVVAGGCLVGLCGVAEPINRLDRTDRITQRLEILERSEPKVVFFGSSLFHTSIDADTFAAALNIEPDKVINLAGPSFGVWETDAIVRRYAGDLTDILVVIEVTPWSLNQEPWHPILHEPLAPSATMYQWASWDQLVSRPGELPTAVALSALPVLRTRRPITQWVSFARDRRKAWPDRIPPLVYHTGSDDELATLAGQDHHSPEVISTWYMKDYKHSDLKFRLLEQLVEDLDARGAKTVLMWPVVKERFYDYVSEDPHRRSEFERTQRVLSDMTATHPVYRFDTPAELGISDDLFVDYGHMSLRGAKVASAALATRFVADGLTAP